MDKISCTVAILTRNSAATLGRALLSTRDFADIVVCDSRSTDDTLDIARAAGARVIPQDTRFLDDDGRIVDYAGVRNQVLRLAEQDWFLFLDADEYLTPELVQEISHVVQSKPKAYWVPRYYTWGGKKIDCSTTYPNKQMRFFNRRVAKEFIRKVHERIELLPWAPVGTLAQYMVVPLDTTREELWHKWDRYIALGDAGQSWPGYAAFVRVTLRHMRASAHFALRHLGVVLFCRGTKLPLWRELAEHRYNFKVILSLWRRPRAKKS